MENGSNTHKRRKVRKGTQSCWECKRRKTRCTFATSQNSVCDGCKSRRTRCIGQEYEDEAAQECVVAADRPACEEFSISGMSRHGDGHNNMKKAACNIRPKCDTSASAAVGPRLDIENTDFHGISRALILEWPSKSDLDLILCAQVGISALLHGLICRPYAELFRGDIPSAQDVLQPPHEGLHPVLVARKLLLLATFLQSIPTSAVDGLNEMSADYRVVMSSVFKAATRLVTTNEELITTLEGIECVMMESMFLNNAGNLRRAWLANRRAMNMAQIMGLHIDATSSAVIVLEKDTHDRIDPKYMWFRLVVSDRYLSLMLGLPQGVMESSFAEPNMLEGCTPLERMERMESVAASLVLQRSSQERIDLASTYKIDKMMRDAAALMPPQWWLVDTKLTAISDDSSRVLEESVRLTAQFAHHHLLVQLHLPYILLPSSRELSYDYSKMVAANSSREVLVRFIAYRSSSSTPAYCRGIDFISFIASTALCLAHMQTVSGPQARDVGTMFNTFQSLQHQRLSDRGLLERTLEVMEMMAFESNDLVAGKIVSILRPLLDIESNSLKGGCYHITVSTENLTESEVVSNVGDGVSRVRIQIPHFGTIQIEYCPPSMGEAGPGSWISTTADSSLSVLNEPRFITRGDDETRPHSQAVPSFPKVTGALDSNRTSMNSGVLTNSRENHLLPVPSPDLDDWVLQGVDIALFNSLTAGDFEFAL
ncbi:hypothetical protein TWF102_011211 [Orbilia oligospora]|uniref:Zn(2)-C6 fungal-type domain-containing protein n=1 Tax=Orbilia oligospora TaxID=2813651 RepID=A0A7C8N1Y9_ORBOL|nr:hypothetical protein TWF706_001144 [Orbilia oligospora]KAF3085954.1 hypothetical protein TWF102_011211 [Orbilia oligospora]KAF3098775.1 hypothetical protein TWF103_008929 [Orbilia oligospora]KAF3126207.1 hypothetical protein TWF594_001187 [Orbilia oligospora]